MSFGASKPTEVTQYTLWLVLSHSLSDLILPQTYEVNIIYHILHMRKVRLREIK